MNKLRYAFLLLLSVTLFISCNRSNHTHLLAQADSLLECCPDSALKLLDSINRQFDLPQAALMHLTWNRAQIRSRLGLSMTEDTLLPRAVDYYRQQGDSVKLLDGYLLEGRFLRWNKQDSCALTTLDSGLHRALTLHDTAHILSFYREKGEIYHRANRHAQAIEQLNNVLKYSDKLSVRDHHAMYYALALNLSLMGDASYPAYYEQSIDRALIGRDTASACHYIRNYADCLAANGHYEKSNELVQRVLQLMPVYNDYSVLKITLAGNFIHLRQLDSAKYYWDKAWASEQKWQAAGYKDFAHRAALAQMRSVLDYAAGTSVNSIDLCRFGDSIMNEMKYQQNTIVQQLETKSQLQQQNYELTINRQQSQLYLILAIVLLVSVGIASYLYVRNKQKHLAETEERVDALTRLLNDAQRVSDDSSEGDTDSFFKKILLQQLGIIRLVAGTPTSQNQALLKLISGISNNEIPVDGLLVWVDLYSIIDKLYDNFYTRLTLKFGTLLSDKEVQICCLLCANFSTKEIGVVTQQTSATIYVRKTAIRKKIDASEKQDIVDYINTL